MQQNLYNVGMSKELGAVYTPSDVADLLVDWAIQAPTDLVLDLGVGEGVFVFASFRKLTSLGASPTQSASQIYGTEINETAYTKFVALATELGFSFPHLTCQDFFRASFPQVDVIVGNPPYVRRRGFPIDQLATIRSQIIGANPEVTEGDLSRLTDVYVYFLLHAAKNLKSGGRLAVVIADSWLNVRYGHFLKSYLKTHFDIERITTFDRPLFANAQVKPVLVFATKRTSPIPAAQIAFTRVTNGLPVSGLSRMFHSPEIELDDVRTKFVSSEELDGDQPWGIHFKIPEINALLAGNDRFTPLQEIALTRIGIQTLAKRFLLLHGDKYKILPSSRIFSNHLRTLWLNLIRE